MESDLGTCPKCGEDKAAGMRVCHNCLNDEAPSETAQSDLDDGLVEVPPSAAFSEEENHLCRRWFDSLQDVSPAM